MADDEVDPASRFGQTDGSLEGMKPYISWQPGDDRAILDGWYTAAELRAIARWMDSHPDPEGPAAGGPISSG